MSERLETCFRPNLSKQTPKVDVPVLFNPIPKIFVIHDGSVGFAVTSAVRLHLHRGIFQGHMIAGFSVVCCVVSIRGWHPGEPR